MTEQIREGSPRFKARMAGVFYLLNGGTGFAYSVRGRLVVPGDAAATAANILAHERLFRMAMAADLVGVAAYGLVAALLFGLFRPVSRTLSLVAAFLGLVGCAIQAGACVFDLGALSVLNDTQSYGAFKLDETQAMVELLMRLHGHGFNVAIVFFGFYCVLIGFLIFRSMFMPRIIGVLMALGGAAYVGSALAGFLSLPVPMALSRLVPVLGGLGELSLMLWLLVVGVNAQRWKEQAAGVES
jgi:hypothetical protein